MAHAANVNTSCPICGDVQVRVANNFALMLCADKKEWSFFSFTCPKCQDRMNRPATPQIIKQLTGLVPTYKWEVKPTATGPVVTEDDLIAFGVELERSGVPESS